MRWWLEFGRYVRPHWAEMAAVLFLLLMGVGLTALVPWPLKLIVDYLLAGEALPPSAGWITTLPGASAPEGLLLWLATGAVAIFVVNHTVAAMRSYIETGLGGRIVCALGEDLFEHLQRLSLRFHARRSNGDLVRRVTVDSTCVRDFLIGVLAPLLTSILGLGVMFIVMWWLDPYLTLVGFLAAIPLGAAMKISSSRIAHRSYEQQELEGRIMSLAEQTLAGLPAVKSFAREEQENRRFRRLSAETIRAYLRTTMSQLQFRISVGTATATATALIMGVGGIRVLDGSLSVGSLLVFLTYLTSFYAPMETLAFLSESYAGAAARARRVQEILDTAPEVCDPPEAKPLPPHHGERGSHVQLDGVTFGYEPGHPVLQSISLHVSPGEVVALIGSSGAGKSTLASLIPRLFDPWEGSVMLDGVDLRAMRLADLRQRVSVMLQQPFLLPTTIAANIAYGRPEASREEIVAAAAAAEADSFVRRLPQGYDTVIGERGATLSGGEQQRLAIARAILKDAPVIVLDEPTSALDSRTEASVIKAVRRLIYNRTAIIIAHRLSTVREVDRIVVMERGKIVEMGRHEELMAAHGRYRHCYHLSTATFDSGFCGETNP